MVLRHQNGITKFFAGEVYTDKLCVGDTCVSSKEFADVFGGSRAAGAPENTQSETPSGSPAPVATKDADTGTSTTPSAMTTPPIEDIANKPEPANDNEPVVDDAAGSEPDDVTDQETAAEEPPAPDLEASNDNQPVDPLPATGTE